MAVGAALVAVGCAPLVDPQDVVSTERSVVDAPVEDGGELVIGLEDEPDALDPTLATTLVGRNVFISMCEKLYDVDADLELVPELAADAPEISDDGLRVTIPLREDDIQFNDGTPFTAEAVKQSLDRHRELPGSMRATELSAVESVEVVDDHTIELDLSRPYPPLQSILADRAGMILSPTALDELGEDFAQDPVCVGPFQYVERVAQDRIVLERSEDYYASDEVPLERVVYRPIPDDVTRLANLRSGQLDVVQNVSPDDVTTVSAEDGLELLNQPSLQYMGITVNVLNADGLDEEPRSPETVMAEHPELREALSLTLDRDAINDVVFSGLYQPACGPIPPISAYATEETQACPEHDLDRARELVAESGLPTPIRIEMMIPNDPISMRLGQVLQAMAAEADFDLRLQPTEFATGVAEGRAGNFDTYIQGWSGRPDPDGNIGQFHVRGGSNNYGGNFTEETDELIQAAAEETDEERRRELYSELVPTLRDGNSIIYLYRNQIYHAHRDDTAGVVTYPDGLIRVVNAGHVAGE
ncbi:hypothetical protein J4H86_22050 [Spiractinospora alimapuensis]|uniref:ABC transporter substrate-binding protein n=1 Tax=Spiractinospora alimapuensis TaxID=2820884 RepID=UPI001F17F62C|nr:ABC transporter substrate-binding protein [Spiractinospora alimapuensis]QVQ51454.1 hypothetical protein J4H86_22050 [Spiractinospora alimapuensis]